MIHDISKTTYDRRIFKVSEELVFWPADLAGKALFWFGHDLAARIDQHLLVDIRGIKSLLLPLSVPYQSF